MTRAAMAFAVGLGCVTAVSPAWAKEPNSDRDLRFEVLATAGARDLRTGMTLGIEQTDHPMSTGTPIVGVGGAIGGGLWPAHGLGDLATLRYEVGQTAGGLRTHVIAVDLDAVWSVCPRAALLAGLRVGGVILERATESSTIGHWGLGLGAGANFDLVRTGQPAFFVRPQVDAMFLPHALFSPRSLLWGGGLALGARL
jgi:hypothetical protein